MLFFNLSAFYFFYFAAVGVYVIFMPKVLHDINYTVFEIGVVFALAPLMRFLTPFLFLKHIKLNQRVFSIALLFSVISATSFYISIDYFYAFLINNAVLGMCLSLILPYIEVIALKELGKNRYGKSRLYGSIGFMLIALLLGKYLSSPFIALHYYLLTVIATAIFSIILLKYDVSHKDKISNKPFSFFVYWPLWVSMFFMQMSFGGFYNFFTIYETSHGITLEMTSYLWSLGVICEIVIFYYQAPLLKNNLLNIIKFSILMTTIRWFLLYLYPDNLTITFISQGLHAFSFGLYHSAIIMYLYTLYDNKKLAQQFMYGVAYGLGGFTGAIFAGKVYGEYLFLLMSILTIFAYFTLQFLKTNKD